MKKILSVGVAALVAAMMLSPMAYAWSSWFNPTTGEGSVAKGDIQQLVPLKNNAAAQAWYTTYGSTVEFKYVQRARYNFECVGLDNKSAPATKDGHTVINVNAKPDFLGRGVSNWAGFTLTGFGQEGGTPFDVPVEDGECSEGNVDGVIKNVTIASNPAPTTELEMKWGDNKTLIPFE